MRSVLLGGVLALSLVAGAVIAGSGANPAALPDPLPQPVAVAAEEPQQPPAEPKAKPAEPKGPKAKAVGIGAPRLQEALDLPVRNGRRVVWSPTGDRFVVTFPPEPGPGVATGPGGDAGGEALLVIRTDGPNGPRVFGSTKGHDPDRFVGFTPDGNELLLTRREYGLVSGRHLASFYGFGIISRPGPAGFPGGPPVEPEGAEGGAGPAGRALSLVPYSKRFPLDNEQTDDFAFAPDGKSYTTLVVTRRDDLGIREATIRRVSTETGKTVEKLGTVTGAFRTLRLTPDGKRLLSVHAQVAHSVALDGIPGRETPAWSVAPEIEQADGPGGEPMLVPSRDGGRVLFGRGMSQLVVLDGATGKSLPALERVGLVVTTQSQGVFSADGRLLALSYLPVEKKEASRGKGSTVPPQTSYSPGEPRLGVWDTSTGKLIRSWPGRVTALAFHPTRPVLGVLEPNGAQTRLGLWDFTAE